MSDDPEQGSKMHRQRRRREEVALAEQAVLAREADLAAAVARADDRALKNRRAIDALQTGVAEALLTHGDDPGLLAIVRQLDSFSTATFDLSDHRARELAVREEAARARDWLATALAAELQRFDEDQRELDDLVTTAAAELEAARRRPCAAPNAPSTRASRPRSEVAARGPAREEARVRMETDIDLQSASNFFAGFSENLSDGGVFIATERRVAIGTEVDLTFRLPDGTEIRGRGVVRWTRGGAEDDGTGAAVAGVGVQFIDLHGAAEEAVRRFIAARDPIFFPG